VIATNKSLNINCVIKPKGRLQSATGYHRRHPGDRLSIEGVIATAENLETAFLRTGIKDFLIRDFSIMISLMKIVHLNCIISSKMINNPKSGVSRGGYSSIYCGFL
jgi:hypothetical protein